MSPNAATSIRARLLNKAKSEGTEFQHFLVRYACERFLYRLGVSGERDLYILKGASLHAVWMGDPFRATRDIGFLAFAENGEAAVRGLMKAICIISCPEDEVTFELDTLQISTIRDSQKYSGQRATFRAILGTARIGIQVDFGFGDVVTPGPEEVRIPTILKDLPAPLLLAYPQISTIAEKFESMVLLGIRNSPMKDFHDIWVLSETFAYDGVELQQAIVRCFDRRGTVWAVETPEALTPSFFANAERLADWNGYRHLVKLSNTPPPHFEVIGRRIQSFLAPVRASILSGKPFEMHWPAGGPWQANAMGKELKGTGHLNSWKGKYT